MPQFAAVTWQVKPGFDVEVAELFRSYKRPDSFVLRNAQGIEVGKIIATAVFMKDATIVRVVEFEGELHEVMRHMGQQQNVRDLENALVPYLATPRDVSSPRTFQEFFQQSTMRCLVQRFATDTDEKHDNA